jgi:hypothetical protein
MADDDGDNGDNGFHPGGTPTTKMFVRIHSREGANLRGAGKLVTGVLKAAAVAPESPAAAGVELTKTLVEAVGDKDEDKD